MGIIHEKSNYLDVQNVSIRPSFGLSNIIKTKDDSSPQSPQPSDEDLLNYQEKGQIFCLDQERRQSLFLYKDPNDIFSVQSVLFQIALTSSSGQPLLGQPCQKVNILTKNPFQKKPMS